jgi:HEAT repeat protein
MRLGTSVALAMVALAIAGTAAYTVRSARDLRSTQAKLAEEMRALRRGLDEALTHRSAARDPAWVEAEVQELRDRLRELESGAAEAAATDEVSGWGDAPEHGERGPDWKDLVKSARAGDPEALAALWAGIDSPDPQVRREALRALRKLGAPDLAEHLEGLKALLDDPDPGVRAQLARTLGKLPLEQAGPLLQGLLGDPSPKVVAEAINSLVRLNDATAAGRIVDLLDDRDADVATAAGRAMRMLGDPALAAVALERVAQDLGSSDPTVRMQAIKRIREIGTPAAITYLEGALEDDADEVRHRAEKIIGRKERAEPAPAEEPAAPEEPVAPEAPLPTGAEG